ncbi:MAG: hypothetical protein FWE20_10945 [Defluviitaleaceae bacterium]|nr:hypothetical protein [Defluviitaleaceae bacterium]
MNAKILTTPQSGTSHSRAVNGKTHAKPRRANQAPADDQEVTLTISPQADECKFQEALEQMRQRMEEFFSLMRETREQADAGADSWNKKITLLKIAMRIMNGDDVPLRDHKYLARHDIDLYMKAVSLRRVNNDPEEHDAISPDEEDGAGAASAINSAFSSADAPDGGSPPDTSITQTRHF